LQKPEKPLTFSGQKRWIFLPGIGSPGKVGNNGIQEVGGSIPIGFTIRLAQRVAAHGEPRRIVKQLNPRGHRAGTREKMLAT
jgi:hypothetical protein